MAAIDEEKQETSFMERAIFIVTPLLFVVVLVGLLIMLLDTEKRNKAIEFGHTIPILKNILPEPAYTALNSDSEIQSEKYNEKIEELQTQLSTLQQELSEATAKAIEQEQMIEVLEQQKGFDQEAPVVEEAISDEQYTANIQELASMFAQMKPSKAAPIVQSMTLDEMALIFSQMRADDRVRIMEKMSPTIAADVTIKLKDNENSKNLEVAALQSRIEQIENGSGSSNTAAAQVNDGDLAATFTAMEPTTAAELMLKMMDISSSKVLRILQATDSTARSQILEAMASTNDRTAAILVSRLMDN